MRFCLVYCVVLCVVCCVLCIVCCMLCIVYCVLCIQQTHMIDLQPRVRCPRVPQLFAKTFLNSLLTKYCSSPLLVTGILVSWPHLISLCCHISTFIPNPSQPPFEVMLQTTQNVSMVFKCSFVGFINLLCSYLHLVLSKLKLSIPLEFINLILSVVSN